MAIPSPHLQLVRDEAPDDEALLRRCALDDRQAFHALATRYAARLSRYCARSTDDASAGDDLAQDALVDVWNARARFSGGDAQAWIFTLALNRCRKHRRTLRSRLKLFTARDEAPADSGVLQHLELQGDVSRLRVLIAALPEHQRQTVLLRFEGELDFRSIGLTLGCSEGAARVRLFEALKTLRAGFLEAP